MEQEAKVCAGGCIRNYADPLPHCDDCSFRQPDEKTTDISYERAAEILDPTHREHYDSMNEIERAANPTTEEAIKYLEGMIFTQDFSPATLMAVAVNTMAIDALREKADREKSEQWCKKETNGGLLAICPKCNYPVSWWYKTPFCANCGKRLEVERGN